MRDAIGFHVMPFALDDPLASEGTVMTLIDRFVANATAETLFVIHAVDARALEAFVIGYYDRFTPEMLRAVGMPRA